jgi:hypothetical protein
MVSRGIGLYRSARRRFLGLLRLVNGRTLTDTPVYHTSAELVPAPRYITPAPVLVRRRSRSG